MYVSMSISAPSGGEGVLGHLGLLIEALETRTSAQTSELMALVEVGAESRQAEEALWQSIDNLLDLRRRQMLAAEMLVETARGNV